MHILVKNKKIYFLDYKLKCSIGKRGIKRNKVEGDKSTPKGTFKLKYLMYRKDRNRKIVTQLKKIVIKRNMGWCDDIKSKSYNKLIKLPHKFTHEKLYRKDHQYDILVVLNYNLKPIKKNKGSAIFIHIAKNNYMPTNGCVALSRKNLKILLKNINKKSRITIV